MKRATVLAVALLVSIASLSAQSGSTRSMPWSPPVPDVPEGRGLIAVGFWGDVIGIGLVAGGGAAYSFDAGVANALIGLGLTSMLFVGNPCLQRGLTLHHDAVEGRGYTVSPVNRKKSRLFSMIALGCGGGSLALGIASMATDSFGLAIASNVVGLTGAVIEIINFYVFRRNWGLDMKQAAGLAAP